jgi:hypothetical protein
VKTFNVSGASAQLLLGVGAISAAVGLKDGRFTVHAYPEVAAALDRLDPDPDRAVAMLVSEEVQ